jgi:plasmid stabilization system protein ParE
MGWKVTISPSAQVDLEDIVRYIARHNPEAAARIGCELIARAEGLADFPEMGRMVPEFRRPELREVIHRSYRVIYRVKPEGEAVEIVRFWHGARGFPHIPRGPEP